MEGSKNWVRGHFQTEPWEVVVHQLCSARDWMWQKTTTPPQTRQSPSVQACIETFHLGKAFVRKSATMSSVGQ